MFRNFCALVHRLRSGSFPGHAKLGKLGPELHQISFFGV